MLKLKERDTIDENNVEIYGERMTHLRMNSFNCFHLMLLSCHFSDLIFIETNMRRCLNEKQ